MRAHSRSGRPLLLNAWLSAILQSEENGRKEGRGTHAVNFSAAARAYPLFPKGGLIHKGIMGSWYVYPAQ